MGVHPDPGSDRTQEVAPRDPASPLTGRLLRDVAALCQLVDQGISVDGEATLVESERWAIFGRTTYDGEVILAEYDDLEEATAVLLAMPRFE
ncbi:hypothetical protein [Aquihabitans sp. McL0605]|uniref:hypothetical protein n=1 Tax=Aquihabitans sp. McL0605 TaxID=3415671 RepID=UPI003CFB4404